jgi:hypothetical protein
LASLRQTAAVPATERPDVVTDAVVGHHMNPYASGVARFNQILAERFGVPFLSVLEPAVLEAERPLFSFKLAQLGEPEEASLTVALERSQAAPRAFLHEYDGTELEERLVRASEVVYCGNDEVAARVRSIHPAVRTLWAPGLILDHRVFRPAFHSIFSFGMAHKVRTDLFRRLRDLLDATGETYALYMSNANHATATLREAQVVYDEMRAIFPHDLYFLGNLSDVAIYNYLRTTTFFAAFFPNGVRANNTSVLSAMEHGSVVITNLDEHSPSYLVHMDNVIDLARCDRLPSDPVEVKRMSLRAMETARELSWDRLVDVMRHPG